MYYNHESALYAPATVGITVNQLFALLQNTPQGSPAYIALSNIAASVGLTNKGLGFSIKSIGGFLKNNFTSSVKDYSKIHGQILQVATPIISAATGIPVGQISGFVGQIGNMVGGDIGNAIYAVNNGGISIKQENQNLAIAQQQANAKAQAEYDAQVNQQQAAIQNQIPTLLPTRNPIGYVGSVPIPDFSQIVTMANQTGLPIKDVKKEVEVIAKEAVKETTIKSFEITPTIAIAGLAVVVGGIYLATKK